MYRLSQLHTQVIEKDRISLEKVEEPGVDNPFALFTEWDSETDREAYAKL